MESNNLPNKAVENNTDWIGMIRKLYAKRKLLIISCIITVLVVYPIARTNPKIYSVQVKLAPELTGGDQTKGLSSLMKTMGLNKTSSNGMEDAILPTLYPDLMNSKTFLVSLFDVPVTSKKGDINTTYYKYLLKHQKSSLTSKVLGAIFSLLPKPKEDPVPVKANKSDGVNAGALSKKQYAIANAIAARVRCDVDQKTGVITINVTDQDPVICATIADSTCSRLQEFITDYRTKKARVEMDNAQKQYDQAKVEYEDAKQKSKSFNDSHWDLVDDDLIVEKQALQNNMQMCFSNMSTFNQQLLAARAKYESLRPVYTVLDGASVPLKPSGPGRMRTVFIFLFLVLAAEAAWILYSEEVKKILKEIVKEPEEENKGE